MSKSSSSAVPDALAPISLKRRHRPIALLVNAGLLLAWVLVYFLQDAAAPVFALAAVYNAHVLAVWAVFIWTLTRPRRRIKRLTVWRLVIIFVLTVLQFSLAYAAAQFADDAAFFSVALVTGARGRAPRLGLSVFLAVESMASLGTGTMVPVSAAPVIFVAFNSVFAIVYTAFIVTKAFIVFAATIERLADAIVERLADVVAERVIVVVEQRLPRGGGFSAVAMYRGASRTPRCARGARH